MDVFAQHVDKGLLLDANLLLLLLVGYVDERCIAASKRTRAFTVADYRLLRGIAHGFRQLWTTPHILTEVTDLADLKGAPGSAFYGQFRLFVQAVQEHTVAAREFLEDPLLERFGLADMVSLRLSSRSPLLLTVDTALFLQAQRQGAAAVNFNHLRSWSLKP